MHRLADVPLAEGRVFEQLAVVVAVALRRGDGAGAFDNKKAIVFVVESELIGRATGHHKVVAVGEIEVAVHRAQRAGTFMNENHLVCIGIFIKIIRHALAGSGQRDAAFVVDEDGLSAAQIIVFWCDLEAFEAAVLELFIRNQLRCHAVRVAYLHDLGRRVRVVNQRIQIAEPFGGEQLLGIEAAVGLAELGVALGGYLS